MLHLQLCSLSRWCHDLAGIHLNFNITILLCHGGQDTYQQSTLPSCCAMGARIYTNIAILLCHAGQESSDHSYPDVAEVRPGSVRFNNAIREQASSFSEEVLTTVGLWWSFAYSSRNALDGIAKYGSCSVSRCEIPCKLRIGSLSLVTPCKCSSISSPLSSYPYTAISLQVRRRLVQCSVHSSNVLRWLGYTSTTVVFTSGQMGHFSPHLVKVWHAVTLLQTDSAVEFGLLQPCNFLAAAPDSSSRHSWRNSVPPSPARKDFCLERHQLRAEEEGEANVIWHDSKWTLECWWMDYIEFIISYTSTCCCHVGQVYDELSRSFCGHDGQNYIEFMLSCCAMSARISGATQSSSSCARFGQKYSLHGGCA